MGAPRHDLYKFLKEISQVPPSQVLYRFLIQNLEEMSHGPPRPDLYIFLIKFMQK
jgi:hypothetical protein